MFIELRIKNHRSLRDEQLFTMEAGRIGDDNDPRPRTVLGHSEPLLTVAAIYGANASGKSNVLSGLAFMRDAVIESARFWSPHQAIPRDQFKWGAAHDAESSFCITFLIGDTKFEYGFTVCDDAFTEEWLYGWTSGRRRLWYSREGEKIEFGPALKGDLKTVHDATRKNALFLPVAVQLKNEQLDPIYSWFFSLNIFNLARQYPAPYYGGRFQYHDESFVFRFLDEQGRRTQPELDSHHEMLTRFKTLLQAADFGISDVQIQRMEVPEAPSTPQRLQRKAFLKHDCYPDAWLPLEQESNGTKTIFRLALPIIIAIRQGLPLFVDELEASLHPTLANHIVRLFNDPEQNPRNAQLIFTTHDTNLLGTTVGAPAVRRDQVWLTEKDESGATVLYPLTDYKPRKEENIERGYLQGRYGAIPFLGHFNVDPQ